MPRPLPLRKKTGGYKKPYRATLLLSDILLELGTTHLQEVYTAFRKHLKEIVPRRVRRFHLPSRDTIRVYIYYAHRLGLIEYTGEEGVAHRKDGNEAPDLARRKYFRIVAGEDPRWALPIDSRTGMGWKALAEGVGVLPSELSPIRLVGEARRPKKRMPGRMPKHIEVPEELAPIKARMTELLFLVESLPESLNELAEGLAKLVEPTRALVRKAPESLDVARTFESIGTALELLGPALAGRPIASEEMEDLRRALAL